MSRTVAKIILTVIVTVTVIGFLTFITVYGGWSVTLVFIGVLVVFFVLVWCIETLR